MNRNGRLKRRIAVSMLLYYITLLVITSQVRDDTQNRSANTSSIRHHRHQAVASILYPSSGILATKGFSNSAQNAICQSFALIFPLILPTLLSQAPRKKGGQNMNLIPRMSSVLVRQALFACDELIMSCYYPDSHSLHQ